MSECKNYIEDLTNFDGNIHELKQIVDALHTNFGWDAQIKMETKYNMINVVVTKQTLQ